MNCKLSTFMLVVLGALAISTPASAQWAVEVNLGARLDRIADVYGINKSPLDTRDSSTTRDFTELYEVAGITGVRTHDTGVDLSKTYLGGGGSNCALAQINSGGACGLPWCNDWVLAGTCPNRAASYDFTEADRRVQAIIDGDFEVYLRVGESFEGVNSTSDLAELADVASNFTRHYFNDFATVAPFSRTPVFVEFWNEPDGAFWSGTDTDLAWVYSTTHGVLANRPIALNRRGGLGGLGFTQTGVTDGSMRSYLNAIGPNRHRFLSSHFYLVIGGPGRSTRVEDHRFNEFLTYMDAMQKQWDALGWDAAMPPLHLTEWNISHGDVQQDNCDSGNCPFDAPINGAFASAILTWLQYYDVERAHFYDGYLPDMGMFWYDGNRSEYRVTPAAWAFHLHSDLVGRGLEDVSIGVKLVMMDPITAGKQGTPVTALASGGSDGVVVILTNLGNKPETVELALRNSPGGGTRWVE